MFLGYQLHQLVKNYQHIRDHLCPIISVCCEISPWIMIRTEHEPIEC
jgi:hypothetical protein